MFLRLLLRRQCILSVILPLLLLALGLPIIETAIEPSTSMRNTVDTNVRSHCRTAPTACNGRTAPSRYRRLLMNEHAGLLPPAPRFAMFTTYDAHPIDVQSTTPPTPPPRQA